MRVRIDNKVGMIGEVISAIGRAGGDVGAIDIVQATGAHVIRDITVDAASVEHSQEIVDHVGELPGVEVVNVSDRTFLLHLGGKIKSENKAPLKTRADLSMAYTPGVARVCMAIHADPEKAYTLTIKKNTVAVVTDGTAVLGLGDIGPKAAMPVMEGKAMLFKEFADIDAWPICLDTTDPDEVVRAVKAIAPEIPRAALYSGPPRDLVAMVREAGATSASPHFSLVSKDVVEKVHAAGMRIVPWTPNEPEQWDKLIDAGVDEIITDDPAGLIGHLKKRGLR